MHCLSANEALAANLTARESAEASRLTLALLLQEVGSIIGKKGEIVKRFREEVSPLCSVTDEPLFPSGPRRAAGAQ